MLASGEKSSPSPDLTHHITRIKDQYSAGGAFGDVYKCLYHGSSEPKEVAVKAFRFSFASDASGKKSIQMLRRELGIWRRLQHDNIVPFLGIAYGFGMDGAMSLVSLWMPNESLEKFLTMHDNKLAVRHRLQFLLDIANGLNYLHSFRVPVVHGDLNCNNILLDADYSARLADFGYASLVGSIPEALGYLQRSTARPGALRWVAPEQIDLEEYTRTTKSDVYSFGSVSLQVLSGKQPWSEIREDAAVVLRLAKGHKPARPESRMVDDAYWDLIQHCWSSIEERPTASVIISAIERFLENCPISLSLRDALMSPNLARNEDDENRHGDGDPAIQSGGLDASSPVDVEHEAKSWENVLKNADKTIETDPLSPWGYEEKHAALHGLGRYDEAINTFSRMLEIIEQSPDPDIRRIRSKYISPGRSRMAIDAALRDIVKTSPLVLIDVRSGRLYDAHQREHIFKSEPQFKELLSSMTTTEDGVRIQQVIKEYFQYVMLSHIWEGMEPLFQEVVHVSVWDLHLSPLNKKLQMFCKTVFDGGYRWAWSDSCCIDKSTGTVLNQSLRMMYKWLERSAATFVHLRDVESPSALGGLTDSIWMTRAWTTQELLAPKVVRFYDCNWKPYLGDTRHNHKESPEIMQELADAIHIPRETIVAFHPDDLSVRQRLQLASTRNATAEEDVAYALIGIFKSDIAPNYGEGEAALGHLLEEIVARSGEVTVLNWTGKSSPYNSCLPISLAVYSQPPCPSPLVGDAEMGACVAALRTSMPADEVTPFYYQVTRLPPARFANRRLHLPSIFFAVKKLRKHDLKGGRGSRYRARVVGIGDVEFETLEKLSLTEPHKLVFVHPWIRDLCDPLESLPWTSAADDDDDTDWGDAFESDSEEDYVLDSDSGTDSAPTSPWHSEPVAPMDDYTRALRLLVRLQQPFHGLLLQQQPNGEFRRVAAESAIVVPGIDRSINLGRDVHTGVVEIL